MIHIRMILVLLKIKVPIRFYERDLLEQERMVVDYLQMHDKIMTSKTEELLDIKQRRAREILKEMTDKEVLLKCDAYKSIVYVLNAGDIK